jgi:hypothetical protein
LSGVVLGLSGFREQFEGQMGGALSLSP